MIKNEAEKGNYWTEIYKNIPETNDVTGCVTVNFAKSICD